MPPLADGATASPVRGASGAVGWLLLREKTMSMLSWLAPKKSAVSNTAPAGNELAPESTQPMPWDEGRPPARGVPVATSGHPAASRVIDAAQHKAEAMARREQLYGAVRESLLRVGVLAASYKFKVLALDPAGRQYLVMIDLAADAKRDVAACADIESLITEAAKSRHGITVTAVYWRVNNQWGDAQEAPAAPVAQPETRKAAASPQSAGAHHEPLQTEEMLAFKRALAASAAVPTPPGTARAPARTYSPLATGYEDTQVVSPDTRPPGLGLSQYGELN